MNGHPSLKAAFNAPQQLEPRQKLGRNEQCWCGSGKKWKNCHRDRERQEPLNVFEIIQEMRAEFATGYCLYPTAPNECSGEPIRSHTIQRRGGLSAISEVGHVISIKKGFEDNFQNDGEIVPKILGLRSASTFSGFCSFHDTDMFRPIETGKVNLDNEAAFLMAFRALSYEFLTKESSIRVIDVQRELDRGKTFEEQCYLQKFLHYYAEGAKLALQDLRKWKNQFNRAFLEHQFDAYAFCAIEFSEILPVVGCGGFYPVIDFDGKTLQKLAHGNSPLENILFNLTVLNDRTVAVLSWNRNYEAASRQFAKSFLSIPDAEKANAMIRLVFEHLENVYILPSWWRDRSDEEKKAIIRRSMSGLPTAATHEHNLLPDGIEYAPTARPMNQIES